MKKAKKAMTLMVTLGLVVGLSSVAMNQAFAQQSAREQLQQMTSGQEHTGVQYDGSPKDQRRSGLDTIVTVTPSSGTASGYETNSSSGTAGGYSVNSSSSTSSGNSSSNNSNANRTKKRGR